MFSRMRMCRGRPTDAQFVEALSIVDACLRVIVTSRPKWWALENPQGYLAQWLGQPKLKFDPCDYGDPWTKNTWIWGDFAPPLFRPVKADRSPDPPQEGKARRRQEGRRERRDAPRLRASLL
jgi:hypothetical protein